MKLGNINQIGLAIKGAKSSTIKLVHEFIFNSDKNKRNRNNLKNFEGFKFEVGGAEFEEKVKDSTKRWNKLQLLNIANFFQIEPKDDEDQIARDVISALCDLETFKDTFDITSDVEDTPENTDSNSGNTEKEMENSEKDAEQDKTKNITSQSGQSYQNSITNIEKEKTRLVNANELKYVSSEDSENQVKEQNSLKEKDLINFSVEDNMLWKNWLVYFEGWCTENRRNNSWKIRNIQRFLKGKALTLYVNSSLNIMHWEELVELFNEEFTTPGEISLSDFSEIRFKIGDNVTDYYHKKLHVGRNLGLDAKLLLEGLTDGLPKQLKQLVVVNSPQTTTEWRELVHKLNKLQISEDTPARNLRTNTTEYQYPRQWRAQGFQTNYTPNTRPWNYRVPFNNPRPFSPPNARTMQRGPRPNNPTGNNVHFQETLPPSPCRICLQNKITNAFHWHRNCPFATQTNNSNAIGSETNDLNSQERVNNPTNNSSSAGTSY